MANKNNNKFESKGKRGNPMKKRVRSKDVVPADDRDKVTADKNNDPSWYANNEFILRDAASLPYNNIAGIPAVLDKWNGTTWEANPIALPGVMGIETMATPGACYDPTSPVNIAARNIYSFVRHVNSGHSNYDSPNLMLYILAMDSLYSTYSHLARMYGLIRTFALRNRFLPKTIFAACGWQYESFADNMAQFRYWLNTLVEKIGAMCVPASMTYMMRHMWMYQNIFADAASDKAQYMFYFPRTMFRYDPVTVVQATEMDLSDTAESPRPGLKLVDIAKVDVNLENMLTFDDIKARVEYCIESILSAEDLNIMSGDILKAFGDSGIWRLIPIHEEFEVIPVYSEEVLTQIHNLRATGVPVMAEQSATNSDRVSFQGKSFYVTKYPMVWESIDPVKAYSYIRSASYRGTVNIYDGYKTIIDMFKDDVSPGDTMVATRLTNVLTAQIDSRSNTPSSQKMAVGSELVTRCVMWKLLETGVPQGKFYPTLVNHSPNDTVATLYKQIEAETWGAKFMGAPLRWYFYSTTGTPTTRELRYIGGDITNFTVVDADTLYRMHETALLSQFRVPIMGVWNH